MNKIAILSLAVLPLAACNTNTATGNDREAQLDPPATAAPVESAASALANLSLGLMLPETMSDADLAALGVAFPSFVYDTSGRGAIKINGKLIPVTASGTGRYANGELRIRTRPLDDEGDAGLQMQELIIAGPRMKDEFGFWGYTTCPAGRA
jgi:hypothetical protein